MVRRQLVVDEYNRYMGGVDKSDQLINLYNVLIVTMVEDSLSPYDRHSYCEQFHPVHSGAATPSRPTTVEALFRLQIDSDLYCYRSIIFYHYLADNWKIS